MRVLCINDQYLGLSITKGKWYEVVHPDNNSSTTIIGNRGTQVTIASSNFRTLDQLREEKLKELLTKC